MRPDNAGTNILIFLRAVCRHWVALLSGGLITVALGLLERLSGRNIPLWTYGCVLTFFAFSACYLAWRDAARRNKPNLIFEVDTTSRSQVQVLHEERTFNPPDIIPTKLECYVILPRIGLRLANHDVNNSIGVWGIKLLLIKVHLGREKEIPLQSSTLTQVLEYGGGKVDFSNGVTVGAGRREKTFSSFEFELELSAEYGRRLDRHYFLRLVMEAAGRPPYLTDLNVDWNAALKGGSFIVLR